MSFASPFFVHLNCLCRVNVNASRFFSRRMIRRWHYVPFFARFEIGVVFFGAFVGSLGRIFGLFFVVVFCCCFSLLFWSCLRRCWRLFGISERKPRRLENVFESFFWIWVFEKFRILVYFVFRIFFVKNGVLERLGVVFSNFVFKKIFKILVFNVLNLFFCTKFSKFFFVKNRILKRF